MIESLHTTVATQDIKRGQSIHIGYLLFLKETTISHDAAEKTKNLKQKGHLRGAADGRFVSSTPLIIPDLAEDAATCRFVLLHVS